VWTDEPLPDLVAGLLDGKPTEHGIADALWSYWSVAVAPYWPPIHAVIEDDVSYRGSQILSGGLYDLLSDLHPEVSLRGSRLLIDKPHHKHGVYSDGELTLVPSVSCGQTSSSAMTLQDILSSTTRPEGSATCGAPRRPR